MVGEGEREPRTQWERGRKRGREKAGRVLGWALKEGNIRPFCLVYVGKGCD